MGDYDTTSKPANGPGKKRKKNRQRQLWPALIVCLALLLIAVCVWLVVLESGDRPEILETEPSETVPTEPSTEPTEDTTVPTETEPTLPDFGEFEEAFTVLMEKNPEALAFAQDYQGVQQLDLTLDLTDTLTPGTLPYFIQWDSRWGYCQYGDGLIGWTGCGPTALSMVAMGLTGDGKLTPAYVADFSMREGYCVPGAGTVWLLFSEGAKKLGLTPKELPLWESTMRAELEAGHPIICNVGPGHFTDVGHYIVLAGCDEEGFQVLDPFRPSNCITWRFEDFSEEVFNLWCFRLNG